MTDVRETLAHLFGLGRYQNIQVDAALKDAGVVLTYRLVPVLRVRRIAFQGSLQLPESELRRAVVDRYGASPSLARAEQAVSTLQTLYRDHGYPRAQISTRADAAGDGDATLVFAVDPGVRARIGTIDVQGAPLDPIPTVLDKVALKSGEPYDGIAVEERLAKYAGQLRAQGYYEARLTQVPRFVDQDQVVNLALSVEPGPHVEIVFHGDPLTPREQNDLVPIAREHSVDEDILEDAKFGIEGHYRARGYCSPRADYQRNTAGGVLTIVFTVSRGAPCVLESDQITGNAAMSSEELGGLVNSVVGEPFNENTVGADAARIGGVYRRRGFAGVKVAAEIARGDARAGVVPVRVTLAITEGVRTVVSSVAFEGNAAISGDGLRPSVTSTVGQPYVEPQISSDADAIAQLYLNRGYPDVSVQPNPQPTADRSGVDLHFIIHEGTAGVRRSRADCRQHADEDGDHRARSAAEERPAAVTAGGRRHAQPHHRARHFSPRRYFLPAAARRPDASRRADHRGGSAGHDDQIWRRPAKEEKTSSAEHREVGGAESFQLAPAVVRVGRRNLFGKDRSLNLSTRVSFRQGGANVRTTRAHVVAKWPIWIQ